MNMEQPKFNPASPEYKKTEDLPEAVQKNYVNLPEGGFVRKTAVYNVEGAKERAKGEKEYEIEGNVFKKLGWILSRATGGLQRETMGVIHQQAYEQVPIKAVIENAEKLIGEQVYIEMYEEMKKKLDEIGKSGWITCEREGAGYSCKNLYGEIDGAKIYAHYNCSDGSSLKVDEEYISGDLKNEIISKYAEIALDRGAQARLTEKLVKEATEEIQARYDSNNFEMRNSKQGLAQLERKREWQMKEAEKREKTEESIAKKLL